MASISTRTSCHLFVILLFATAEKNLIANQAKGINLLKDANGWIFQLGRLYQTRVWSEVCLRFQCLLKLPLWIKGVEWVKALNALGPLCLWQCFEYPLDIKESQHRPWPSWDCPERIIFFSVCGNKPYSKSVRKPNSYIILHHQQQSLGQRSLWGKIIHAIYEHSAAKIRHRSSSLSCYNF